MLGFEHVLEAGEREPDPDHYRQHILHIDPAGRFSVAALVWLPGHGTPVHDHLAWCVSGVLTGRELEHRFSLAKSPDERTVLQETGTVMNDAGDVSVLTRGPDIHQVRCADAQTTISLHVYGTDITANGSSINLTYDTVSRAVKTTSPLSRAGHAVINGSFMAAGRRGGPYRSGHTGRFRDMHGMPPGRWRRHDG